MEFIHTTTAIDLEFAVIFEITLSVCVDVRDGACSERSSQLIRHNPVVDRRISNV